MNENEADSSEEDGGHKSNQEWFRSNLTHGFEARIEPDPSHGDEDEKLPQCIEVLNKPLPLSARNEAHSVSNGSENGKGQESKDKEGDRFRIFSSFGKAK